MSSDRSPQPYQVFFFPSAGAGVAPFFRWRRDCAAHVAICPICPPGRESRFRESIPLEFESLVEDLRSKLIDQITGPYVLFGHSMGALVAYELGRRLARDHCNPLLLVAAACKAPHFAASRPMLHELNDNELIVALNTRYGDHSQVFEHPEARRTFLPIVRADLRMIERHELRCRDPLPCPILAIRGSEDATISDEQLSQWQSYSQVSCDTAVRPGGHFFVHHERDWILDRIDRSVNGTRP